MIGCSLPVTVSKRLAVRLIRQALPMLWQRRLVPVHGSAESFDLVWSDVALTSCEHTGDHRELLEVGARGCGDEGGQASVVVEVATC